MKKTLLLTLASGALLTLAPAAHASPKSMKLKPARIALMYQKQDPCAGKLKPAPATTPNDDTLFRSYPERELINPG